jgi:hypothetical protein
VQTAKVIAAGLVYVALAAYMVGVDFFPAYAQASAATVVDVRIEPEQPRTGDTVKIWFNLGEGAERAEVRWSLNGEEVQLSDYIEAVKYVEFDRPAKTGDTIVATITPFDASGEAGMSIARRIVCATAPPELNVVNQRIEDNSYRAKVEARDPQGGTVSLSLDAAPPGMKMDPRGSIDWPLGKDTAGRFPVKVRGKTGQGGEAVLSFDVGIKRGMRAKKSISSGRIRRGEEESEVRPNARFQRPWLLRRVHSHRADRHNDYRCDPDGAFCADGYELDRRSSFHSPGQSLPKRSPHGQNERHRKQASYSHNGQCRLYHPGPLHCVLPWNPIHYKR